LDPQSIYKFEATCRALSNSIIAARAAMDHSQTVRRESLASKQPTEPAEPPSSEIPAKEKVDPNDSETKEGAEEGPEEQDKGGYQASRVSKRLRSQIITSGKRAERSTRRSSVEYCLLAATLGCTPDDEEYQRIIQESLDASAEKGGTPVPLPQKTAAEKPNLIKEEARERVSESSLKSFVMKWASQSATPLDVLFGFAAHASLNVGDVFSSDPGGAMVLSSCLMECKFVICVPVIPSFQAVTETVSVFPNRFRSNDSSNAIIPSSCSELVDIRYGGT